MPAYGSQIIPQVPEVGNPRIPQADHTVAEMIARTGTAGLAAFTNMAAQAQRAELEREQMAQHGALKAEELAFRREDSARDYGLARERLTQQQTLAEAARTFQTNRDAAIMQQATEFTNYLANSPHQPGTPEFYKDGLKAVAKWPLAGKNPMAAQAWKEAADIHDNSAMSIESARAAAQAAGIDLDDANVSLSMGPKGPSVSYKTARDTSSSPSTPQGVAVRELAKIGITPDEFAKREMSKDARVNEAGKGSNDGDNMKFYTGGTEHRIPVKDFQRYNSLFPVKSQTPTHAEYSGPSSQAILRTTADGRKAYYDPDTKKFIKWAE